MAASRGLTRNELYEKVWSHPVRTVAREFGISDVGLKKICARHEIPTPGRGYWAKIAHGQRVHRTPLPERRPGKRDRIFINKDADRPWHVRSAQEPDSIERERLPENRLKVSAAGSFVHSLARSTDEHLKSQKTDDWLTAAPGCLDVRVSPLQLPRALRIMDALLVGCESRGWKVANELEASRKRNSFGNFWHPKLGWIKEVPKDVPAETGVVIRGQTVAFSIVESSKQAPPTASAVRDWRRMYPYSTSGPPPRSVPNGELLLEIVGHPWVSGRRRFHDLVNKPLEDQLNGVIVAFIRMAAGLRAVALKNALERRRELLAARKARDAELRRRELERKIGYLNEGIERWEWERRAREFLAFVRSNAENRHIRHDDLAAWIAWAERYIEERGSGRFFRLWMTDEAPISEGPDRPDRPSV